MHLRCIDINVSSPTDIAIRVKPLNQTPVELDVDSINVHPEFLTDGYDGIKHNIAVVTTPADIDLAGDEVGVACLPQCVGMFDYEFSNGTGTR